MRPAIQSTLGTQWFAGVDRNSRFGHILRPCPSTNPCHGLETGQSGRVGAWKVGFPPGTSLGS